MCIKQIVVAGAVSLLPVLSGVVLAGGTVDRLTVVPMDDSVKTYITANFGHEDALPLYPGDIVGQRR